MADTFQLGLKFFLMAGDISSLVNTWIVISRKFRVGYIREQIITFPGDKDILVYGVHVKWKVIVLFAT